MHKRLYHTHNTHSLSLSPSFLLCLPPSSPSLPPRLIRGQQKANGEGAHRDRSTHIMSRILRQSCTCFASQPYLKVPKESGVYSKRDRQSLQGIKQSRDTRSGLRLHAGMRTFLGPLIERLPRLCWESGEGTK